MRPPQPQSVSTPWQGVSSSNVEAIRQDGADLWVRFRARGGRRATTYIYRGAGHLLASMVAAPSKGKYVHHVLIPTYPADGPF